MSVTDARYSAVIVDQVDKAGTLPGRHSGIWTEPTWRWYLIGALGPPVLWADLHGSGWCRVGFGPVSRVHGERRCVTGSSIRGVSVRRTTVIVVGRRGSICSWPTVYKEGDVERWAQSASVLHSNGDAMDIAVCDERIVGVRGREHDRVNGGRLGPKDLF